MTAVYSRQVAFLSTSAAGSGLLYTAPSDGSVNILVCISLTLFGATTEAQILLGTNVTIFGAVNTTGHDLYLVQNLRQVINAGQQVRYLSAGSGLEVMISGYHLV